MPRRCALFDLDGTLLDGDTDELWCEFLMDEGVLDRADFEARNRSIVERYRAGSDRAPAEFCAFYASTLRGRTRSSWAPLRERFVATRVAAAHRLRRPGAGGAPPRGRRAGAADHRDQPLPHRADRRRPRLRAEPDRDRAGGRGGGHLHRRQSPASSTCARARWCGCGAGWRRRASGRATRGATFYSDSANDLPLLRAVRRAVAVDPDPTLRREAQERGWAILALPRTGS